MPDKITTGVPGLDAVLNGGLQAERLYLVEGTPGSGKTTLALQFLLAGQRLGGAGLYFTLSESRLELEAVARSHGWDLDGISICELINEDELDPDREQSVLHPFELELGEAIRAVIEEVQRRRPSRVVFDSLSELRLLSQNPLRFRRQMLALKRFFAEQDCAVLLIDDRPDDESAPQLHSLAHGVFLLEQIPLAYGAERRRIRILKLRGATFSGGWHDYVIRTGGLVVFPRELRIPEPSAYDGSVVSSGAGELDALLGGGLVRGSNTLLIGPSGAGKTSTSTAAVLATLERGERAAFFLFDELLPSMLTRSANLGMDLRPAIESGGLLVRQIDPAQMSPGEFAILVRDAVERDGVKTVVIDSLDAYMHSMPGDQYLMLQMHELLAYLGMHNIVTLMILGQHGQFGDARASVDLSYLANSVVLLRFFELGGMVRKAISVLKTRTLAHEPTVREFTLGPKGVRVGPPLRGFRNVLSGVPTWVGTEAELLPMRGDGPA